MRRPKLWVPRSCQAAVESLERGDRIRRTASSTSTKVTKRNYRTQSTPRCHISFTRQRNTAIYLEIAVTFTTSVPATILCEGGHHGPREYDWHAGIVHDVATHFGHANLAPVAPTSLGGCRPTP